MKKRMPRHLLVALTTSLVLTACSDSDSGGGDPDSTATNANLMTVTRIDDTNGFLIAIDAQNDTAVTNANGLELLSPSTGIFSYNDFIYTTGSRDSGDNLNKYSFDGTTFKEEAEISTGEDTFSTSFIFVDDTKAYVILVGTGELLVVNPDDLSITKRIDLSAYALGEGDTNPEPSSGVIRDGKLYLGLAQFDSMQTWRCQAGASVLIIDVATDVVEKHLQDGRACLSGIVEPNSGLILDELGDIYVNNLGSYGFYPDLVAGFLRIKNGETEFDPGYFFQTTGLSVPGVPGEIASYSMYYAYTGDGMLYTNLFIPGLASSPPDFVNDKNFMSYRLDLRNQTATLIDIPPTAGWSSSVIKLEDKIIFGRQTVNGNGLYSYAPSSGTDIGDQIPYITTVGSPGWLISY